MVDQQEIGGVLAGGEPRDGRARREEHGPQRAVGILNGPLPSKWYNDKENIKSANIPFFTVTGYKSVCWLFYNITGFRRWHTLRVHDTTTAPPQRVISRINKGKWRKKDAPGGASSGAPSRARAGGGNLTRG